MNDLKGTGLVKCAHCGDPTPFEGTKLCSPCWELDSAIAADLETAKKILDKLKPPEDTTSAMLIKTMEVNKTLRDNIDRIFKTCGNSGTCRGSDCRQPIVWMKTKAGKTTVYNYDGSTHWATCKSQRTFKNGGKQ